MSPLERRRLGEARWKTLKPKCVTASSSSEQAMKLWAEIAAEAVVDHPPAHWRPVLSDLRERCWRDRIECPYTLVYMVQLAETCNAVKGNFDRGVPVSVLVEGRHHPGLLKLIKTKGMTVSRMKAHVYLYDHPDDERSVDEVEAEQRSKRQDTRDRSKRNAHAEKIMNWPLDKAEGLLQHMKNEVNAYTSAVVRLRKQGAEFDSGDIAVAEQAIKSLSQVIETLELVDLAA